MAANRFLLAVIATGALLSAQNVTVFPSEYTNVPEGPYNSPYLPFAYGTSRVMLVYNREDLAIPSGSSIQRLGFREDHDVTTMHAGRALQLEVRMGYTANNENNLNTTYDSNYIGTPVTVFGPALFTLPNLRDPAAPLPNGQFFLNLTTPFPYVPGTNNLLVEYRIYGTSGGGGSFNYYVDRADYYSPVVNGPAGCLHLTGGPATLTTQPVSVNNYYSAYVAQAPQNSFCVLAMSLSGPLVAPYSLQPYVAGISPTCVGQVPLLGAESLSTFTSNSGTASFQFYIPNAPAILNDVFLTGQCAFFDFFAPGGIVVSNGAQVQIGIPPRTRALYAQGPPSATTTGSSLASYCPVAFFGYQ